MIGFFVFVYFGLFWKKNMPASNYPADIYQPFAQQLLDMITLDNTSQDSFVGQSFDYVGNRIFGGQVLAQALMAAAQTLATPKPCHSLHGYFLRGGDIRYPVHYDVSILRDGKSLSARQVCASQYLPNGDKQVIFMMMASFCPPSDGLTHQTTMPNFADVDQLIDEQTHKQSLLAGIPTHLQARFMRQKPIVIKPITPYHLPPIAKNPTQAVYLAIPHLGKQSIAIQQALLAFSSDFYLVATALLPHGLHCGSTGLQLASIDHSMYFHRPFELDNWLVYDLNSDTASHSLGLNHGKFWQDGKLVATTTQQGLMRLVG